MELIDGHFYSHLTGMYLFKAIASPSGDGSWFFQRFDPETRKPIKLVPGELIAFMKVSDGCWWRCYAGDPAVNNGQVKLSRYWIEPTAEYWEHLGEDIADHDVNEMLRFVDVDI